MSQVILETGLEFGIVLGLLVGLGELVERVHQGLGDEPAAVRAETAQRIGAVHQPVEPKGGRR